MKLKWSRPYSELKDVMYETPAVPDETAYWVFDVSGKSKWKNMTVISPKTFGREFPKTFGHYHPENTFEIYRAVAGDGLLLLQKKHVEKGKWDPSRVDEVYMVKFEIGDELTIPFEFGHSWSNLGTSPLISLDDWDIPHTPGDYNQVKDMKGMAFYLIDENGLKFVPNPNYKNLPEPQIITAKEFSQKYPVKK